MTGCFTSLHCWDEPLLMFNAITSPRQRGFLLSGTPNLRTLGPRIVYVVIIASPLDSNTPIGPIFPADERCGIYVIEFDDGTKYVGQSIDVVKRFRNHTHGSNHHESWDDVVALSFAPAPPLELDILEKQMIQYQLDAGVLLRNRSGVLASEGPSPLDLVIPVTEQSTGFLGIGNHHSLIAQRLSRPPNNRGQQSSRRTHPQKLLKLLSRTSPLPLKASPLLHPKQREPIGRCRTILQPQVADMPPSTQGYSSFSCFHETTFSITSQT